MRRTSAVKRIGGFVRTNAIGMVALVVALSGTAYAASKIGAQDIKPNAIRSFHIKSNQVKADDLARGVRQEIYSSNGGQTTTNISDPADQLQIVAVKGPPGFLLPEQYGGVPTANCPPGYVVVGTGFNASIAEPGFVLKYGTFVGGFFSNYYGLISAEPYVEAICAKNSFGGATTSSAMDRQRYKNRVAQAAKVVREAGQ